MEELLVITTLRLRMLSLSPNTDSRSWLELKNIHTINKVVPTYQLAYYWPYHPRTSKKYLTCLGYVIPDVPTHGHLPICLFEGRNLHLLGGLEYGREGNWNKSMTLRHLLCVFYPGGRFARTGKNPKQICDWPGLDNVNGWWSPKLRLASLVSPNQIKFNT